MNKMILIFFLCFVFFAINIFNIIAETNNNPKTIKLLQPDLKSGKLLMQALKDRKSSRDFSKKELSNKLLSNLLWAGFGVNRKDGKHTAPSAINSQNILIYVAMKDGVYKYIPSENMLIQVFGKDIRKEIGFQSFLGVAPVVLIFVADFEPLRRMKKEDKLFYSIANTGYISQNIYLYCASENLATVAVGWAKRDYLVETLKLDKNHQVMLIQPVGFPVKDSIK